MRFKLNDLFFGLMAGDGGADVGEELLVVPRLLDEVFGPCADGVDDVANGAVGGDHDDRKLRVHLGDAGEEVDAGFAGERQVEEEKVVLVASEGIEAGGSVDGHRDVKAFEGEESIERLADGGFVVDDEDSSPRRPVVVISGMRRSRCIENLRHVIDSLLGSGTVLAWRVRRVSCGEL